MKTAIALICVSSVLNADNVFHKFELWGGLPGDQKMALYIGWTNGYFYARPGEEPAATCLNSVSPIQAVAIVDRRYASHPETWSRSIGEQIYNALVAADGPCPPKKPVSN